MNSQVIKDRLESLRKLMGENGIDFYLFPTADYHNSEYVNDYFKVREYFCNFSGSNGDLLVWKDGAGLWTDGRYFIQAEHELEGTGVTLFRMLDDGVPTIEEFLEDKIGEGETLAFDGRVISVRIGEELEKHIKGKNAKIRYDFDVAEKIWKDRPDFPASQSYVIPDYISGKNVSEKLSELRAELIRGGADAFLLSKLDDIAWLFNMRADDVPCNPVFMSYAYITLDSATLFIQDEAICEDVVRHLKANNVTIENYNAIFAYAGSITSKNVLLDKRNTSYSIFKAVEANNNILFLNNPTERLKAIKNPVELKNMEKVYIKDSVALTKFIYWLKNNIGKEEITEVSAADYLEQLRRSIPEFIDLSFDTIAGYNANAAMMHYKAEPENCATLKPEGRLLVESGGQYVGGTTDVTRTIVLGPISDEIKKHYTLVCAGMLELTNAHWLYGCTGRNLDMLARKPLWDIGLDYKCGTGHGVGYILNVHEGPQNMRWRFTGGMIEVPFEDGMDITNEPGVYIEGSHGIRIENVMVAKNDIKNEYGQFMHFETLTWAPIDMEAIDLKYLSREEMQMLKTYQDTVYEKISPYLTEEEKAWLKKETKVDFE
ncbi:MAG: aminopeptidase P family protein [Lachnospiraceae bacterium]|nr:aminopeptidase P family protein [Lachnospiraceae bacterium]